MLMSKRAMKASFKKKKFQEILPLNFKQKNEFQAYKNVDTPSSKNK